MYLLTDENERDHAQPHDNLVDEVRRTLFRWIETTLKAATGSPLPAGITTGKYLRTKLAAHIIGNHPDQTLLSRAKQCSVAIELVHAASLFHDDIVDGAVLRRGSPALWQHYGTNGAVLTGDLFFCGSLSFIMNLNNLHIADLFVNKVHQMCSTEVRQELQFRGKRFSPESSVEIARGKTGSLFSFIAAVCGTDEYQSCALEEAGYRIGTAYQLMDDLNDEHADELQTGKTHGTDRLRGKFTLAHSDSFEGYDKALSVLHEHLDSALRILAPWPSLACRINGYLSETFSSLQSVTGILQEHFDISVKHLES